MTVPEYTPGDWYAVVAGGAVLLLAPSTPPEVVRDVWASAPEQGGGLGAQLDALVRHGIGELHPFAAVDLASGAVHTALRGDVEVEVVRGTRAEVLSAPRVVSWSERALGAADEVTVRVAGAGRGPALPIVAGVVRASRVRVRLTGGETPAPAAEDKPVVLAAQPTPVAVVPAAVPAEASAQDASVPEDEAAPAPAAPVAAAPVAAPAPAEAPGEAPGEAEPAAEVVPARAPVEEPAAADEPELVDDVAPVEDAVPDDAAAPAEDAPPAPAVPAWAALDAPLPPLAPPPAPAGRASLPFPPAPPAPQPVPALPGPASADDHDGLTILSGELASIRQNLPSWAVSQTGDWPSGAVVPTPSGPGSGQLETVPAGQAAAAGPVPRIALSTGALVPVDGVVLIGRAPQPERAPEGSNARLITVPSPEQDISRTHAEVRLEHGRVLVTDLYSTNGVTVAAGGLPPRRIAAGEPIAVGDGDLVDLGDGVTFTVEPGE